MIAENEPQNDGYDDPKLLNVSALARCLSVSVRQTHRMNRAGLIPAPLKIGGCTRWCEDEISEWLKCGAPPRGEWEKRRGTQTVSSQDT
ncbi:MAG: helix-turn-helix domain-containing protein [Planctomycetota bacterium]|nr:helix-turn-helix domain-containing protein [Planctomycetota bacterium]